MTATARDRRDQLRAMLADLKMPGALEAVDGVLAKVDSGAVTAGEATEQPAPPADLEVGEVCLPQLIGPDGLVLERVGGLDHTEGWTGDQVVCLEPPVARSF